MDTRHKCVGWVESRNIIEKSHAEGAGLNEGVISSVHGAEFEHSETQLSSRTRLLCVGFRYIVCTRTSYRKVELSFETAQDLVVDRSTQPTVLLCGGEDAASRGTSAGQDAPPTQMGIV